MPIKQKYYFLLNRAVIKLCGSLQIVRLSIFSVFLSFETCCIVFSFLFFFWNVLHCSVLWHARSNNKPRLCARVLLSNISLLIMTYEFLIMGHELQIYSLEKHRKLSVRNLSHPRQAWLLSFKIWLLCVKFQTLYGRLIRICVNFVMLFQCGNGILMSKVVWVFCYSSVLRPFVLFFLFSSHSCLSFLLFHS